MIRNIKVFISSTFRDLDKERSYIVQQVFSELQHKYPDFQFCPIDLRWGITEEESKSKQVVDLCLKYLHDCQPYFIGILGDRYGSVLSINDTMLSPIVKMYYPDLLDDLKQERSITEIEIMNGVLRSKTPVKALFFVKRKLQPYPEESLQQFQKQQALIQRVREQSTYQVIEFDSDLQVFDQIKEFFIKELDLKDPIAGPSSDKNIWEQTFIANSELHTKYLHIIPNIRDNFTTLAAIAKTIEQSDRFSVIRGLGGSGRSALLAHLGVNYRPEANIIYLHLYGDQPIVPLTGIECLDYLLEAARRAIRSRWSELKGWDKLFNWFRVGLTDHNVDIADQLIKEMARYKWRFIFDNLDYNSYRDYIPLWRMLKSLIGVLNIIREKSGINIDWKITYVEGKRQLSDQICPTYELNSLDGFHAGKELHRYLSRYFKKLDGNIGNHFSTSPIASVPGYLHLLCYYMVQYLHYSQIPAFVERISSFNSVYQVYAIYIDTLIQLLGQPKAKRIISLLLIHQSGIFLDDLQKLSKLSTFQFRQTLNLLRPFLIETNVIRIQGGYHRNGLQQSLSIKEEDLHTLATESEVYFDKKIIYRGTWEYFVNLDFTWTQSYYFSACIPNYSSLKFKEITEGNNWLEMYSAFLAAGGRNEINSDKAYRVWICQTIDTAIRLKKLNPNIPGPANPTYLQAHIEALLASNNAEKLKKRLIMPIYVNALWHSASYVYAWKKMLNEGLSMRQPSLRKMRDVRTNRMQDLCQILNRLDDISFYE